MSLRVKYDELELVGFDAGGGEILKYQGQLFTGIIETVTDDVLVGEEEFKDGSKEGVQRDYYYPSGNIEIEYFMKDNGFNGVFRHWDEAGNLIRQSNWQNGEEIL